MGFALGIIEGTERLSLLCPCCRRPTAVVTAWIRCGHCDKLFTKLMQSQQELLIYSVDLRSGLCKEQPQKARAAKVTAKGGDESEAGDSNAKKNDFGEES